MDDMGEPQTPSGDGAAAGADRPRGILANFGYSLISQVASGGFTAVLTLYLVRALGPKGYGVFALAVSVGTLVALPADFGVSSSTARFVAEHRDDPLHLASILADSVRLKAIVSGVACAALAALAGPIAAAYHAPIAWPLRFVAAAIFGQSFMSLFQYAFIASRRTSKNVRIAFGESAVECGASVAIVALGGGAAGATGGRALGYVCGGLLALAMGARAFGWPRAVQGRLRGSSVRRIASYAGPLMLVDTANSLFATIDVLLIGIYLSSRQTGLFNAPMRLLTIVFYVGLAVTGGIAPRMARRAGGGGEPDGESLIRGLRALMVFYSLLLAPWIVWSRPIVEILLGGRYGGSVVTLRVLSISMYIGGLAPLVSVSANYLGDVRSRVPLMVGAALLDGVIDVILIPRIGIVSGAIATAAAYAVMVAGHMRICARHVDLGLARVALTAVRALIAAGVMAIVLILFGANPRAPMLVGGALAGVAVYGLTLFALGEVSEAQLEGAWRWTRMRTAARTPGG